MCQKWVKRVISLIVASLMLFMEMSSIIPSIVLASTDSSEIKLTCSAHVQTYAWLKENVVDSQTVRVGTEGKAKRMEALEINVEAPEGVTLKYRAHVQTYGWQNWVTADNKSGTNYIGTTGQRKRVEGIQIVVEGLEGYELKYRAHVQTYGWLDWVTAESSTDGLTFIETEHKGINYAGTSGVRKRMEALEIMLVPVQKEEPEQEGLPEVEEIKPEEAPKAEEPRVEEIPKVEEPEQEELPKVEEVKPEEAPKAEQPKIEETPKVEEEPKEEQPKVEEEPKADEEPKIEEKPSKEPEQVPQQEGPSIEIVPEPEPQVNPPKKEVPTNHVHNYTEWKVTREKSCLRDGEEQRTCKECGAVETRRIKSHDLVRDPENDRQATCTTRGEEHYKCIKCGQVFFNYTTPALGHKWNTTYTIDKDATCTENGEKSIHCTRCSEKKNVITIQHTGHEYETKIIQGNCVTGGKKVNVCKKCGDEILIEKTPAGAHSFTPYISDGNATCERNGTMTQRCKLCGYSITTEELGSRKGHNFELVSAKINATCETDGREAIKRCSTCGKTEGGTTIKATGHDFVLSTTSAFVSSGKAQCTKCKCVIQVSGNSVTSFGTGHIWDETESRCTCGSCDHNSTWWKEWEKGNKSGIIWFTGFTCDMSRCVGFYNSINRRNEETILEGRRGEITEITMKAPAAREGYEFEGWYQVVEIGGSSSNKVVQRKIDTAKTENGVNKAYVSSDGYTITVPIRDMDKGFEARYRPVR